MGELELKIEKLIKDQILITESEAQDLATLICNLPEIKGGRVGAEVSEKIAKMAILTLHNWMHAQIRIFEKQRQAKEQESNRENWNAGYVACCEDIIANLKGFLRDNYGEENITEQETIIKNFISNFSR